MFILWFFAFTYNLKAQNEYVNELFQKFLNSYNSGDLVSSDSVLLLILDSKVSFPDEYLVAIYNNLGAICTLLGRYKDALNYYSKAETLTKSNQRDKLTLGDVYINKAIIYESQKSFTSSIEYYEKGIRKYLDVKNHNINVYYRI